MKLEDQVCNLELAKRLSQLGVKQESLFYWCTWDDGSTTLANTAAKVGGSYSAFTAAELGEMLPSYVQREFENRLVRGIPFFLEMKKTSDGLFYLAYWNHAESERAFIHIMEKSEADARGKMLIYLIESKLVKL